MRDEVDRFTAATGIPCDLDPILPSSIPNPLQEHIFRAVAEGLTNVARHAHAQHVWVRVAKANDGLEIVIRDDGSGFDSTETNGQVGHYGLTGLRERARLAGGSFEIMSGAGRGTTLTLRLPITESAHVRPSASPIFLEAFRKPTLSEIVLSRR